MDYLICNGTLIDPADGLPVGASVLVRNGVAEAYAGGELPDRTETIDATGCYVVPGLMDSHVHLNREQNGFGENADLLCLPNGVTAAVDAGSLGADGLQAFLRDEAPRYDTDVYALAHMVSGGQRPDRPDELADPEGFDEKRLTALFRAFPTRLRGLKLRYNAGNTAGMGLRPLHAALDVAARLRAQGFWCPLNVHLGPLEKGVALGDLLGALGPGDVVSHVFQSQGETILDGGGRVKRCVWEARERGVLFDFAHGRMNFTRAIVEAAASQGFYPDLLGTDIHAGNRYVRPALSMMQTLSMMNGVGMPTKALFAAATAAVAKAYGLPGGAMITGAPADLAILRKESHAPQASDRAGESIALQGVYTTLLTMRKGQVRYRQSWF